MRKSEAVDLHCDRIYCFDFYFIYKRRYVYLAEVALAIDDARISERLIGRVD